MSRAQKGYPSDTSDAEWAVIEPLLPPPGWGGPGGGRPPAAPRRDVVDAIFYLVRTGCSWRQLPTDFPPWQTVYRYFHRWQADGTLDAVHDGLRTQVRHTQARHAEPSAGLVDAQSVRGADTVGADTRGFDAGKRVNGRKRHIVVDTMGLLLMVLVTAASVQDRDGGRAVIDGAGRHRGRLRLIWADGGYAGKLVSWAKTVRRLVIEIVNKPAGQRGFTVLPRRWAVERTFAWLMKCRRLAADYERSTAHAEAMIKWAMVGLMSRRLASNHTHRPTYNWT